MQLIRDTTWPEIFDGWEKRESGNPGWVHCATKIKGWSDWKSWRKYSADQIQAEKRDWKLYEFTDPMNEIPDMLVGPYSGWQSMLPEKNSYTFDNLIGIPEQFERFREHEGVLSIMSGLPFDTDLIGLVRDDTNKIVCFEGHHRATAISLAKKLGKDIDFSNTKIRIALTTIKEDEIKIFDEILKLGTSYNLT